MHVIYSLLLHASKMLTSRSPTLTPHPAPDFQNHFWISVALTVWQTRFCCRWPTPSTQSHTHTHAYSYSYNSFHTIASTASTSTFLQKKKKIDTAEARMKIRGAEQRIGENTFVWGSAGVYSRWMGKKGTQREVD